MFTPLWKIIIHEGKTKSSLKQIKSLLNIPCKMPLPKNTVLPEYADDDIIHKTVNKVKNKKFQKIKERNEKFYDARNPIVKGLMEHHECSIATTESPSKKARYENKNYEDEKTKQTQQSSINNKAQIRLLRQRIRQIEERVKACEFDILKVEQPMVQQAQQLSHKMLNKALSALDENSKP